ncbi:heavy metal translocating P-type ATPase [Pseudonocardia sp. CA-107938]|uniref:heavy metal translocating P-type ATPase n=1 Tax=Pseudonocardia sp. CA-107938 TaxID=3240021 RepID=UPI003D94A893
MSAPAIDPVLESAPAPAVPALPEGARITQLRVDGMTCGACAARIERIMGRIDGISAQVNYATGTATITHPVGVAADALVAVVEDAGYTAAPVPDLATAEPDDDGHAARLAAAGGRAAACVALAVPVVVLSMVPALQFPFWQWVALGLTLPTVLWGGWPLHRRALAAARHGTATMDTLVSLGTLAALGWSLYAMIFGWAGLPGLRHAFELTIARSDAGSAIYLEVAAGITAIVLAGRYCEERARRSAGSAVRALSGLAADEATVLRADGTVRVPTATLVVGDLVQVADAERIPTDGIVIDGSAWLDASLVTGESAPMAVQPGTAVIGGAVARGGPLLVRATRVGADTQLARMAAQVRAALGRKARAQRLADRVCAWFVPVVLVLAAGTCAFWLGTGAPVATAAAAATAVLIVACPCALGLATPTALLVGTGRAARLGILSAGPQSWEVARRVDTVLLDKTGTVTTGALAVQSVTVVDDEAGGATDDVLAAAGAVSAGSNHPISRALTAYAAERVPFWPAVHDVAVHDGRGVSGETGARSVLVGSPALMQERGVEVPGALQDAIADAGAHARTPVVVAWNGRAHGVLGIVDTVRPTSAAAVSRLRALGLEPVLLTGDSRAVADAVAAEVGITRVLAEVLPTGKADAVHELQLEGRVVAMVGDGVNDAPALAEADLGIAMAGGTDVAVAAAGLTLVRPDLGAAADAIVLSRRIVATLRGNLAWAFGYNLVALPLAASGLLHPMLAGAAMVASSLLVIGNSLRLHR